MGVELQISREVLSGLVVRAAQRRLRSICLPQLGPMLVDHVDTAGAAGFEQAGDSVVMRLPLEVFLVRRDDVLAGGVPPGATRPAGRADLMVKLAISGTVLTMRCVGVDLGPFAAAAPQAGTMMATAIGQVGQFDLGPALTALGLPPPSSGQVAITPEVLAARLDASGPPRTRLVENDDWGVFLDAAGLVQLTDSALTPVREKLGAHVTSMVITPTWRPIGTSPHLDVRFAGKAAVPDPLSGEFEGVIRVDLNLTGPAISVLRATIQWSLEVDTGILIPDVLEDFLIDFLSGLWNPADIGAIPLGPKRFAYERSLPALGAALGARFVYANLPASADGMLLGGAVFDVPRMNTDTIKVAVDRLGGDVVTMVFCSQGALDATAPTGGDGSAGGSAVLRNIGTFCGAEIISPADVDVDAYVTRPAPGTVVEEAKILVSLPADVASQIQGPVQVLVRTARGVRLIDFGAPPAPQPPVDTASLDPNIDPDSIHLVPTPIYIDDCLHERPVPETHEEWLRWIQDQEEMAWHPDETQVTGPDRVTEWAGHVRGQRTITAQLITVTDVEPGETVQFRSRQHSVDVTAGAEGTVVVPVLVASESAARESRLGRVSRQSLAGHLSVDSVVFQRRGAVPAGLRNQLLPVDDAAVVVTEFADRTETHEFGRRGHTRTVAARDQWVADASGESVHAAAKATPIDELSDAGLSLPGVTELIPLPGFEDRLVRIAELTDGSRLVVDLGEGGRAARVTGTFTGPIGALDASGRWALAQDDDAVSIFEVQRSPSRRGP